MRTEPPFRADHVGSLLRPKELLKAREDHAAGRIDSDELRGLEDEAIREVIARQEEIGLQSATDGEFRRESWHMDFIYSLGGVNKVQDDTIRVHFHNKEREYDWAPPSAHVDAKLSLPETIFGSHFEFLREHVSSRPAEAHDPVAEHGPLPRRPERDRRVGLSGSGRVLGRPDGRLRRAGPPAGRARLHVPAARRHVAGVHERSRSSASTSRRSAATPSTSTRPTSRTSTARWPDRPSGMSVTTHMCRGNNQSMWAAEGGYEFVAEALFNGLQVDGFFCEWDDERSGGFEPLRFVPKGKQVVLGLVTSKRPELESEDYLMRRIEEASQYIDVDQLCLSPQCGFSSTKEGNDLTSDEQFAKLRRIVEVAERVWG